MSLPFIYHLLISGIIFYLLASGLKFFVKLKGTIDFSYLGIVIFASYASVLLNIHRGRNMLAAIGGAFSISIIFTFLILYLSSRLDEVYFAIGTLALYILSYQLAFNLESITGGPFGLSGMQRQFMGIEALNTLEGYLIWSGILGAILLCFLLFFKKTYFYTILQGRGERDIVITSLGVRTSIYKFVLIVLTTLIATVGGSLYSFYLLYIDPSSFWMSMLILVVVIAFVSYRFNDIGTFLISLLVVGAYEGLRFFKVVDPSSIGYFREIIFALLIMGTSFWIFKTTKFGRET